MKKGYIMSAAIGAFSASAIVAYLLSNEENREKMLSTIKTVKNKVTDLGNEERPSTLEAAGIPDQTEYLDDTLSENADMVSEGSQYGVAYFNEKMENEKSDNS